MILHDLAADHDAWRTAIGFTIGKGKVVWESAEYTTQTMRRVRVARLEGGDATGCLSFVRYVSPDAVVSLVFPKAIAL